MPQGLNADHRSNRLLTALEPEDFACLEPHLELVNLTHKQVLFDMGDAVSHAYFPHNAIVPLINVMEDGATVEVGVFGCEGVLGLLSAMASRKAFGRYIVQVPGAAYHSALPESETWSGHPFQRHHGRGKWSTLSYVSS